MEAKLMSKVISLVKVRDFLGANSFGTSPADEFAAKFAERVNRAQTLFTEQAAGEKAEADSTEYRKGLKRQILAVPARHVAPWPRTRSGCGPGPKPDDRPRLPGAPRPRPGRSWRHAVPERPRSDA